MQLEKKHIALKGYVIATIFLLVQKLEMLTEMNSISSKLWAKEQMIKFWRCSEFLRNFDLSNIKAKGFDYNATSYVM